MGSGGSGCAINWQPKHVRQCLSAARSIPGHHTLLRRFCLVPMTPRWPSCARFRTRGLNFSGIIMRVPLNTNCPMMQSSLTTGIYCLHSSKHPVNTALRSSFSSGSSAEACSTSRVFNAFGVDSTATNRTYSSASWWWFTGSNSFSGPNNLYSGSAMFFGPGTYTTLYWYFCNLSTQRSIRALGFPHLPNIISNGLWSVTRSNGAPSI